MRYCYVRCNGNVKTIFFNGHRWQQDLESKALSGAIELDTKHLYTCEQSL